MHVQIVTFGLGGASERDFLDAANQVAPAFSAMGGLQAKLWLENAEEGRYGAVYLWDDREAMEEAMRRHGHLIEGGPAYSEAMMEHFEVLENLTRQTQPVLDIVPGGTAPARRSGPRASSSGAGPATRATKALAAGGRKAAAVAKDTASAATGSAAKGTGSGTARKPAAKKPAAAQKPAAARKPAATKGASTRKPAAATKSAPARGTRKAAAPAGSRG